MFKFDPVQHQEAQVSSRTLLPGGPDVHVASADVRKGVVDCWGVTEGAAGMASQVKGLAQAVGLPFEVRAIPLKFPWKRMWPGIVPVTRSIFAHPEQFNDALPRLLICCGKQSVMTSLYLKKRLGDRIFTVQIQDPKINSSRFDLVVVPEHDGLTGPNVIASAGAVHHINDELLAEYGSKGLMGGLERIGPKFVLVLVGGPTKYYAYSDEDLSRFEEKLARLATQSGARLAILTSRRTPASILDRFRTKFGEEHFVWDPARENPYLTALALCSHIIVTGDSVSMISEASATGKPVFVEYLTEKRKARRFRRFHESFQQTGIVRPFEGRLAEWTYTIRNDTAGVAEMIRDRIRERGLRTPSV